MTVNGDQHDDYAAGTGPGDFTMADEIPGDDPGDGDPTGGPAPYGWTRDRKTGTLRPKIRPGRPAVPPSAEELAAMTPAAAEREPDRAPAAPQGRRQRRGTTHDDPAPAMPRGGIIAAGVDKLYRRAGKLLRALDHDIGQALIECTRADLLDEGEMTVGQAWEQLAKTNPRIRQFLLRAIAGGAWGDLIMAHAPVGIALVMKPAVQRLIPWQRVVESMAEPDEDTPEGEGGLPGGMTAEDFEVLKQTASEQARRVASRMGMQVSDAELAEAAASVGGQVPAAFAGNRQQRRAAASQARKRR